MKLGRTQILIIAAVLIAMYVMYRRERYEKEEEDKKKVTQKELDAVIKFIKQ